MPAGIGYPPAQGMQRRPMAGGMPGAMPGGAPPGGGMNALRSAANPTDAAMINQELSPQSNGGQEPTVMQVLQTMGIDPNGPASQFRQFLQGQTANADPATKMMNMGRQGARPQMPRRPMGAGMPGAPGGAAAPGGMPGGAGGGGLRDLLANMNRGG